MSAPNVRITEYGDGFAAFTVEGRPYAELRITGDAERIEFVHGVLIRMIQTAYQKGRDDGRDDMQHEIRNVLGVKS